MPVTEWSREALSCTEEPQLFDTLPFVYGNLEYAWADAGERAMPTAVRTVELLALVYVARRAGAGQINRRTAEQLRSRLRSFAEAVPPDPMKVRKRHVEKWMERPDLAPQYRRSRLSAVRGFCRWMVSEGHMKVDPCLMVPMPKVPPKLPKRLTEEEARTLAWTAGRDIRTLLVVLLMLQEGLRRSEVAALDIEDIDFAEHSAVIRGKGGMGGETSEHPITEETWRVLVRYLAEEGHKTGPLIRNRVRKHGRMAPGSISELVRQAMVDAGVKRPGDNLRTPHSCRHTMAHDTLRKTQDIRAVQKAMRHASVRSTEVYLRGFTEDIRTTIEGRSYATPA